LAVIGVSALPYCKNGREKGRNVDLLGEKLIELLAQDANHSTDLLAKKLRVAPATIRRRRKELQKQDILRIVGAVNPKKIGYNLTVMAAFDVETSKLLSALNLLSNCPEVTWCSTTTGRFDIIALLRLQSTDELAEFIKHRLSHIEGLKNCETSICLHSPKWEWLRAGN